MNVTFTAEDLDAAADAAVPYSMDGDTRLRAKRWPIRVTAAGAINTSIASFANWLRLHLDKGEFAGTTAPVTDLDTTASDAACAYQRTGVRRVQ